MLKKSILLATLLVSSLCFQSAWVSEARASSPVAHAPLSGESGIPGSEPLGDGWYSSAQFGDFVVMGGGWNWCVWLGYFYYVAESFDNWIYSFDLEWCYVLEGANASSNWWCWIYNLADWSWTTASNYPNVYLTNVGSWCWFDAERGDFYNHTTGQWFEESAGGGTTVDWVLINAGGFDAAAWNMATQIYVSQASAYGVNTIITEANELIIRYELESVEAANQLRNSLKAFEGNQGGLIIEVR